MGNKRNLIIEAMDRSDILVNSIDFALGKHPAIKGKNKKKVAKAISLLSDVYQNLGRT